MQEVLLQPDFLYEETEALNALVICARWQSQDLDPGIWTAEPTPDHYGGSAQPGPGGSEKRQSGELMGSAGMPVSPQHGEGRKNPQDRQ